jgi:hypothetical protein
VGEFAGEYANLLEMAVVEYVRQVAALLHRFGLPVGEPGRQEVMAAAFRFAERFMVDEYGQPWHSFFRLPPAASRDMPSQRAFSDFQRGNALSWLFSDAQRLATPEEVAATLSQEVCKGEWRRTAARKVNDELLLATAAVKEIAHTAKLADRERAIWKVIKRGSRGRLYCRELDDAKITPLRKGIWREAPRKYLAAYDQGQPWRHRIQDEKCKIRRKAGLTKLASE